MAADDNCQLSLDLSEGPNVHFHALLEITDGLEKLHRELCDKLYSPSSISLINVDCSADVSSQPSTDLQD